MLSVNSVLLFSGLAAAQNLWATHYSGTVNYLTFSGDSLTLTKSTKTNNAMPSWITLDRAGKALYIPDEQYFGMSGGTLVSFSIGDNGNLTPLGHTSTQQGVVATTLYGGANGTSFIACAHYQTSQLTTFKLPLDGNAALQDLKYTMSGKGANPARQDAPHPHEAFTDPTGDFVLVPDLGADMIRIYSVDHDSGKLTECPAGKTPPGTGPRHGTFWVPPNASRIRRRGAKATAGTMLYIANELGNSVGAWSTEYPSTAGGCLSITLKQVLSPYANNATAVTGTKTAEVHTFGNFLYATNRNDKKFGAQNDSISAYTIASDGAITWLDNTAAYGWYPRTFSISPDGAYIAIGDQTTSNVAIVKRDATTGKITGEAASLRIGSAGTPENEDGLSAVVWA